MFRMLTHYYQTNKTRILRLSAESLWIIGGQVTSAIGSLVIVRLLTEYLQPAQYGELALGLTLASLVSQVVMGGVINGIGRFYSIAVEKQDLGAYLFAARYLITYATVVVVAIGLILMAILYFLGYSKWIALAAAVLVFSVFSGYNSALSVIQNAARQRAVVAFHSGLDAWLKILVIAGAMSWFGTSSVTVVIAYASSSFLTSLSQLYFLRRIIPLHRQASTEPEQWVKKIWVFSLPFSIWGVFTWLHQVSDRWALQTYASISDVGQYAVLFQLGYSPIVLVANAAVNLIWPIMYQRSGDATNPVRNVNVHRLGWKLSQFSVMVTLFGFGLTLALHEQFFGLMVASDYQGSSYLLPWLVLAGGLFTASQMLSLKLMSEMRPSIMTMSKIVTALIGVLLNIFGAALFGVQGVVGAMVIFSVINFVWIALLGQRILDLCRC